MNDSATLLESPLRFEDAIRAFEAQDETMPFAPGGAVFVGSSSVRMWNDLQSDFAPIPVLNRGFGGSFLSDSVFYADRIIAPHLPRAVVVYAGENDIGNGQSGAHVFEQFQLLVGEIHRACPNAEIFFVSIKPSPGRGAGIEQIRVANALAQDWAEQTPRVTYIDIATPMLGNDGVGRAEFFVEDGVHMKRPGYELWREVILPFLKPLFAPNAA